MGYLLAMFVCGILVIGMEMNLEQFAGNCGVSLDKASLSLIYRSSGSVVGTLFAGKILSTAEPHTVLYACVFCAASLLEGCNYATSIYAIFLFFTLMGAIVGLLQCGALLLIRMLFSSTAGPWLQAASFAFQFGVVAFSILMKLIPFHYMYNYLTVATALIGLYILSTLKILVPRLQDQFLQTGNDKSTAGEEESGSAGQAQKAFATGDVLSSLAVFFLGGLIVENTTYLQPFLQDVNPGVNANNALILLTSASLLAQIFMVFLQRGASSAAVMSYFLGACLCGVACQLPPFVWGAASDAALWATVVGTGFFFGPCVGLVFDLWDRYTPVPTAWGSALLNLGLQGGCGFYSNGAFGIWTLINDPLVLLYANAVAMASAAMFGSSMLCISTAERRRTLVGGDDEWLGHGERSAASGEERSQLLHGGSDDEEAGSEGKRKGYS